ncbi:class I SAM-dependent methyltransferase [Frigoriglobus tundricola]|uniref:NDP-hexose 3-C-methyltransferase TylCIII n=1 Tax=Frigoriglobus tundricola TaxID=2774151 RepID=A0A6M5Z4P9_9BACT|nr:class I SAM-dependent methyltransferase [Frigoriglobus tundricola]QJX00482.1 NDP-hexose 3-C-methyltransferase TylCIII [Frigoriglobus tundricola]
MLPVAAHNSSEVPLSNRIERCRLSGSRNLLTVLNLGEQALTGTFPESSTDQVPVSPLELLWCPDSGLLQLAHSFDLGMMYGDNYGYRSGLNQSMVRHLGAKARFLSRFLELQSSDLVLDIGSNDATLLKSFSVSGLRRLGMDPTGNKFRQFYPDDALLVPDFFSWDNFTAAVGPRTRAKLVTSIAMFYDLEDPVGFARQIHRCLDDQGVWHFEQSYMPSMLRLNSYDTICHEHLEYYSLSTVMTILGRADLEVIDVTTNAVNGGSFAVTAAKKGSRYRPNAPVIQWMLDSERRIGLHTPRPFREFEEKVFEHRRTLTGLIRSLNSDGKKVFGYGASTKGNVLLQFCGLTARDIPCIADVNPYKYGRVTPGTHIPIVSEEEARAQKPDYFLVLPWHFKAGIVEREAEFLENDGHLIFPMPEVEIV